MNNIPLLTPLHWQDNYQLLDSGNFEKLEQFGKYITIRPEPQALWDKSMTEKDWQSQVNAIFRKEKNNTERGNWEIQKNAMPEKWFLDYHFQNLKLKFKLSLSSFKHVGIFPEQATNWDFIFENVQHCSIQNPKVLNLFAYTGAASLAAKQAGADVTHVDSIKQTVSWARENMELSQLNDIRWVVEDALKFVQREVRRGNQYQGIILDPPAYGRGADGEKWILEDLINEMLKLCYQLLDPKEHFLIINLYSLGFSALILENLLKSCFPQAQNLEVGELYLGDKFQKKLPLGIYGRFENIKK